VTRRTIAVLAAAVLATAACGGKKEAGGSGPAADASGPHEKDGSVPLSSIPGMDAPKAPHLYVDFFRLGRVVQVNGMVGQETDSFRHGDPIATSLVVWNAPANALVKMSVGPAAEGNAPIASQEKPLPAKPPLAAFVFEKTSDWKPGTYRLAFEVSDTERKQWTPLGIKDFKVE
jgi:hypothetical protein